MLFTLHAKVCGYYAKFILHKRIVHVQVVVTPWASTAEFFRAYQTCNLPRNYGCSHASSTCPVDDYPVTAIHRDGKCQCACMSIILFQQPCLTLTVLGAKHAQYHLHQPLLFRCKPVIILQVSVQPPQKKAMSTPSLELRLPSPPASECILVRHRTHCRFPQGVQRSQSIPHREHYNGHASTLV